MSTRGAVVRKLLAEARDALASGRGHLVVIGDRATSRHLPQLLADALRDELDSVTVPLAGSRETVADCLAAAIRAARQRDPDSRSAAASERKRLALLLPDALSVPTSALRSLHEIASHLGSHRLVLLVDRDSSSFLDPAEELAARIGVSVSKIELEEPTLQLRAAPESRLPEPVAPEPEERPQQKTAQTKQEGELPRFAAPVVIAPAPRVALAALRRARRGARVWRWTAVTAVVAGCLASSGIIRHGPVVRAAVRLHDSAPAQLAVSEPESPRVELPVRPVENAPVPATATEKPEPPPAPVANRTKPKVVRGATPRQQPVPAKAAPRRNARAVPAPTVAPVIVLVNFNAAPWAELEIDGRRLGPTPIGNVRLAAGSHRVRARFPNGRVVEKRIRVDSRRKRFQIR